METVIGKIVKLERSFQLNDLSCINRNLELPNIKLSNLTTFPTACFAVDSGGLSSVGYQHEILPKSMLHRLYLVYIVAILASKITSDSVSEIVFREGRYDFEFQGHFYIDHILTFYIKFNGVYYILRYRANKLSFNRR